MPRLSRLLVATAAVTLVLSGTAHAQDDRRVVIGTPTTGAAAEVGVPVLVTGLSITPTTVAITATELTFDGGATWVTAEVLRDHDPSRVDWRYVYTPEQAGDVVVAGRVVTASGAGPTGVPAVIHVDGAAVAQPVDCATRCELGTYYKEAVDDPDQSPVEVGTRFRVDRPGQLLGASLGRGSYRGPITLRLWSETGVLLAETPWDHPGLMAQIDFPTPVPVEPGHDYVVSYYTPQGGYATSEDFFVGTLVRAPFIVPPGAGVYHYGDGGGFPTETWHDSTYWVLPEFRG
ncbi:DUF4082 domain-containing protein [Saccharothrix texasensis]|uniref:Uncharacterized protein DUF4082 n=1 Tax=Saccharothrix texasensis TaxID=103734 RepID=A0A3N1GY36_9PSEU|nr:DUF4082 domain-containing protein [Saccharothrix texasensis]ROP35148.1 uncharacterized protein DUF4082 [Saccharothrix texasensis]